MSLKNKLFAKQKSTLIPVTFCGEDCFIRKMTERDLIEWSVALRAIKEDNKENVDVNIRTRAVAWFLCDADGKTVFERDEYEKLQDFDADEITKIFNTVFKVEEQDSKKSTATPN